uniref:ATP synthase subunit a n=1 Tax=Endeis sp. JZ-2022 TaxID=2992007 RepID=A0A9E7V796_9CHEL|nr:ATP synthase F0 subunit 6 [Endeis sp. JZ-2022]
MMNNMFSIFDPTSSFMNLKMNWMSLVIILMAPTLYKKWVTNSRMNIMKKGIMMTINNDFKTLMKKNFTMIFPSTMIMIMMMNSMGLLPYIFTPTTHLSTTFMLAAFFWVTINIYSWSVKPNYSLVALVPMGTPQALTPFMVLIELISNMIRPITLSIRLMANMTAGHLLISLMSSSMMTMSPLPMALTLMAQMFLMLLEMAVAMIQAYVIMTLTSLYFNEVN